MTKGNIIGFCTIIILVIGIIIQYGSKWTFTCQVGWDEIHVIPLGHNSDNGKKGSGVDDNRDIKRKDTSMDIIWNILVDFENYQQWNTFTTHIQGLPSSGAVVGLPGSPVYLTVSLSQPWPLSMLLSSLLSVSPHDPKYRSTLQLFNFRWIEFDSTKRKFCWGIQYDNNSKNTITKFLSLYVLNLLLTTCRCCELEYQIREFKKVDDTALHSNNNDYKGHANSHHHHHHHEGVVRIRHSDRNIGLLAPIIRILYNDAIEDGFRRMTQDLILYTSTLLPPKEDSLENENI